MDDAQEAGQLPLQFELPKSHLAVRGSALEKRSDDGKLVAVHQLESITQVKLSRTLDHTAVGLALAGGALGYCGWNYVASPGWSWAAVVGGALLTIVFLTVANQTCLEIQCAGETVRYTLWDDNEHCHGFCLTLKQELMPENLKKRRLASQEKISS